MVLGAQDVSKVQTGELSPYMLVLVVIKWYSEICLNQTWNKVLQKLFQMWFGLYRFHYVLLLINYRIQLLCLSPLKLWLRIPFMTRCTHTTLCDKVCQWLVEGLTVVFSWYFNFLHHQNWLQQYSWNIVDNGVQHNNLNANPIQLFIVYIYYINHHLSCQKMLERVACMFVITVINFVIIPPANKVWGGYIGITLSVGPCTL
jgi:hypothetical protein